MEAGTMTSEKRTIEIPGIIPALFTLLFMYLKLTDRIDWSWWWVFSPFWLPLAVVLAVCTVVFAAIGLILLLEKICD